MKAARKNVIKLAEKYKNEIMIVKVIKKIEDITKTLDKISDYLESPQKLKDDTLVSLNGSLMEESAKESRQFDDSVLGHLLLLNCGHNGVLRQNELKQYKQHLLSASVIPS